MDDIKENFDAGFQEALRLYQLGVDGDREAVRKAYTQLKGLYEKNPGNLTLEAYLGCALSLLGRDAVSNSQKLKFANDGLKLLDHAVLGDPENMELRLLRGKVCSRLPEKYFHRTSTAVEDFNRIVAHYEGNGGQISEEQYWNTLYDLGSAYKTLKNKFESHRVWSKLQSISTDEKYHHIIDDMAEPEADTKDEAGFNVKAVKIFRKAVKGDADDLENALNLFGKLSAENTENPLISAYYAGCLYLSGRNAGNSEALFTNGMKACGILDEAIGKEPDNIEIRLIRGLQSYLLPELSFKRTATAITDFEYLAGRYEKDSDLFSEKLHNIILQLLRLCYERLGMEEEVKTKPNESMRKTEKKNELEEGIRLFELGAEGDTGVAEKAFEMLRRVYEKNTADALAEAYYGSALALLSRDASDPESVFSYAEKGMEHVNHAASSDPNNKEIRMLRAYLFYNLPEEFFHQTKNAAEDFIYLLNAYEADHSLFPKGRYWQMIYDLGVCFERLGNTTRARRIWQLLLERKPGPSYEALLNEKLEMGKSK